ncbi:MAG: pyruvate dehydrogenase complex dihydrolipoamide acetyltransferase [Rhodocyclaceae bacterium]|nr:pyruvate dehydrogenase complex dihydrolipoamide acetyltransferase [Rhodocyclaceae bacterium]
MATEIIMPSVSTSMTEGILARWLKNEGDAVGKGEIVAEIETDKAVLELEAEAEGVLARRYVADGACVAVGAPMGIILQAGETLPAAVDTAVPAAASPAQPAAPAAAAPPAVALTEAKAPADAAARGGRIFASPLARNLALLNGVDLAQVQGSGPNGRIVKRDIEAARLARQAAAAPAAASPASTPAAAPAAARSYEEIPHSSMRRVIAQRLSASKQQIPHFYLSVDCQLDALLALRRQINGVLPEVRVSVNDFVVKAVAGAMKKVPMANAAWTESAIHRHRSVDVSVAVATPSGLITPVVRDADSKSLGTVSAEVKDLAERARQGKLLPDEYQGGGFTISNLGMFGVREFAAIINPPQACILAVGAGEARAVVRDGAVVAATVMNCTLSVDHRVVDGAVGAEFLAAFKGYIEQPMSLLV